MQSSRGDGLRRNVAILEADSRARIRLLSIARNAGLVALGFSSRDDLVQALAEEWFDLVLVVSDINSDAMPVVVSSLQTHMPPNIAVLLVLDAIDLASVLPFLADTRYDFALKPYVGEEVVTRVEMLLQVRGRTARREQVLSPTGSMQTHEFGEYRLEPLSSKVHLQGQCFALTPREFALILFLFRNPGQLWRRDELYWAAWGEAEIEGSRKLDTYISRLRSRLHLRTTHGWRLSAVYSMGYRLDSIDTPHSDQLMDGALQVERHRDEH